MAGFQFAHVDGYARKGSSQANSKTGVKRGVFSAQDIADEAERLEGACDHVETPQPPIIHFGVTPSEVVKLATEWAEQTKDAKGRKLRVDGLCLAAGVFSVPPDLDEKQWPAYRDAMIEYLKGRYGERLHSVVEHTDEAHRHCHFYMVPLPGENFGAVQEGVAARQAAYAAGKKKGQQNKAYCDAMSAWQDDIWQKVSRHFGLARIGPRRRRLTRAGWHAERRALDAHAAILRAPVPKMPSMGPIRRMLAAMPVEHHTGILRRGEPLYTTAQVEEIVRHAVRHGAKGVLGQRLDLLDAVILRQPMIEEAEQRLRDIASQEAAGAIRLAELGDRIAHAEKREQRAVQAASHAEAVARRAEEWARESVTTLAARLRGVLGPLLRSLVAIARAPEEIPPKLAADRHIGELADWEPVAKELREIIQPAARAAQQADGIDWPKRVEDAVTSKPVGDESRPDGDPIPRRSGPRPR
ncbi:mobilization protein [Aeromonas enteropelogenes]|uniref:mobilization protein n=2 Tax=Aeromonas TaxID=642 RepID=UPI003B9E40A0